MASNWEPASVKAQLRLASLRLGQLQEKKDSQSTITRRDIATLLQQRNVGLARAKAQKLLQEDTLVDVLEILEMHVGLLLEHFNEIGQSLSPSPNVVEAASSIIFAGPQVNIKDIDIVRDLLIQRLGPDFARSATSNIDNYVASSVVTALSAPPPSAAVIDDHLQLIARKYGVKWSPEPQRHDILNLLSEILDPEAAPIVDLPKLRNLCSHGIPDEPSWLRPRVWKLLFGVLPVLKASWQKEMSQQRESYYGLIRRLLDPFSNLPPPSTPLTPMDTVLTGVSRQLSSLPPSLFNDLGNEPEPTFLCPLDQSSPDQIKISCAQNLDIRLKSLQDTDSPSPFSTTPEIRLDTDTTDTQGNSSYDHDPGTSHTTTTLLSSQPYTTGNAHPKHSTALLRLLYLHASINPGNLSPHIPSLLVPLYVVLNQEVDAEDHAHIEADTFWIFEAIVGEFSELEDEGGGNIWMKRFSERLAWADAELSDNLKSKGLDPALPHYSYRWLAPLLTHTLPLTSVFPVWDAIFSCAMRDRDTNPKIDHLLDICTAMLIRARTTLFRLGKGGQKSPSLWVEEDTTVPPLSPLRSWELEDAFLQGLTLLQFYPLEATGGIDRILQTASDLSHRRKEEAKNAKGNQLSLGARLKVTMWKGFTNQVSSPDRSPDDSEEQSSDEDTHDDGNDTETPIKVESPGLTSRLATTVWRGITNQTSMEPSSPVWPVSSAASRPSTPLSLEGSEEAAANGKHVTSQQRSPPFQGSSGLWGYAEKLKDSDTAAAIAKASTNWRAKALLGSWGRAGSTSHNRMNSAPITNASGSGSIDEEYNTRWEEGRRGSLPPVDYSTVSSPSGRPYFRPPRDSIISPFGTTYSTTSPEQSPQHEESLVAKAKILQASLPSLTRSQNAAKSAPRPLLLSPLNSVTSPPGPSISRSASGASTPDRGEWADVMRIKRHNMQRDSQSSVSSLSPSDALNRPKSGRSDWESDTGSSSRFVPLNRRSVSPMAPGFRAHQRPMSGSSSTTSSERGLLSPPFHAEVEAQRIISPPQSSSPRLTSPVHTSSSGITGAQRLDDVISSEHLFFDAMSVNQPLRKKTPPLHYQTDGASDSSMVDVPSKSPRLRTKRYPPRPPNLDIQNTTRPRPVERNHSYPTTLAVEWPQDQDVAKTPRASNFNVDEPLSSPRSPRSPRRTRKVSTETQERHKKSARKVPELVKRTRDSSAEEGDDEGYDDLLSAYESEESSSLR